MAGGGTGGPSGARIACIPPPCLGCSGAAFGAGGGAFCDGGVPPTVGVSCLTMTSSASGGGGGGTGGVGCRKRGIRPGASTMAPTIMTWNSTAITAGARQHLAPVPPTPGSRRHEQPNPLTPWSGAYRRSQDRIDTLHPVPGRRHCRHPRGSYTRRRAGIGRPSRSGISQTSCTVRTGLKPART